ncbi:MAG TPA: hypothetical protein DCR20_01790 [Planctomycetaceae bacterium]|nr:hypothetical protein [Planctomycetaceae bacterium]
MTDGQAPLRANPLLVTQVQSPDTLRNSGFSTNRNSHPPVKNWYSQISDFRLMAQGGPDETSGSIGTGRNNWRP